MRAQRDHVNAMNRAVYRSHAISWTDEPKLFEKFPRPNHGEVLCVSGKCIYQDAINTKRLEQVVEVYSNEDDTCARGRAKRNLRPWRNANSRYAEAERLAVFNS